MSIRTALMEMANNQLDEARKPSPGKDDGFATPDPRATKTVDYGKRMTDARKKKFHDLKKKMTDGPEHQKIMRKNQSRIKSDDEFHNLVLKKAMSEEVELDEATVSIFKGMKRQPGKMLSNKVQVKSFKDRNAMGAFLTKGNNGLFWKETGVSGLKSGTYRLNMVRGKDGKPAREFIKESAERAAWVPESIADEQVEAFMEATLAAVTEGADTFVFEGKHYKAKSKAEAKKLDPVGQADADIDNDGDVDSSDDYLKNRRKAIKKSMKDDDDDEVNEIDGAASGMRAADKEPTVNLKSLKKRRAAEKARKTARPSPLRGKKDMKFESVEVEEAKAPGATAQHGVDANTQDTFEKQLSTRKGEKDFVDQHSMEVGMDIEKITAENKKSIEDALKVTPPRMGDQKAGDNSFVSPIQSNIIDGITKALQQMKTNN